MIITDIQAILNQKTEEKPERFSLKLEIRE